MPTLRELGEAWAKANVRNTGPRYRAELLAAVNPGCGGAPRGTRPKALPQPDLLSRRVDAVTVADVAGVIQAARARGDGEARHLVRALRRLLGFAVALGHIEASPVETWIRKEKGGRRTIPWMRDGIRERVLTGGELAKIGPPRPRSSSRRAPSRSC